MFLTISALVFTIYVLITIGCRRSQIAKELNQAIRQTNTQNEASDVDQVTNDDPINVIHLSKSALIWFPIVSQSTLLSGWLIKQKLTPSNNYLRLLSKFNLIWLMLSINGYYSFEYLIAPLISKVVTINLIVFKKQVLVSKLISLTLTALYAVYKFSLSEFVLIVGLTVQAIQSVHLTTFAYVVSIMASSVLIDCMKVSSGVQAGFIIRPKLAINFSDYQITTSELVLIGIVISFLFRFDHFLKKTNHDHNASYAKFSLINALIVLFVNYAINFCGIKLIAFVTILSTVLVRAAIKRQLTVLFTYRDE